MFGPMKFSVTGVVTKRDLYEATRDREEGYGVTLGTSDGPLKLKVANKEQFEQLKESAIVTIDGHIDAYVDKGGVLRKMFAVDTVTALQLTASPATASRPAAKSA